MSSTLIDQPQSEKSQIGSTKHSDDKNLRIEVLTEYRSAKPQQSQEDSNPAIEMDCMNKIELHLKQIRKSPTKTKLLLRFLENLQASGEFVGTDNLKETESGTAPQEQPKDIPVSTGRKYRGSLPEMACLPIIPRRRAESESPAVCPPIARKDIKSDSKKTAPSDQIVLLESDDNLRPTLNKFDVNKIKPADTKPWSLDVDIALRDLIGLRNARKLTDLRQSVSDWDAEYQALQQRSLAGEQYVYIWAHAHDYKSLNGSYKKEFIGLYGVTAKGRPELLALDEGNPHSAKLWRKLLETLEHNDLANPSLFVGDGNLPIWDIISEFYPRAQWQCSWDSLKADILVSVAKEHRREIEYMLEMMENADCEREALDWAEKLKQKYGSIYPHAVVEIMKSQESLFTFFQYPKSHWDVLKGEQLISRLFPADDIMATVFKHAPFRDCALYLVMNYVLRNQDKSIRIDGKRDLRKVLKGKYPVARMVSKPDLKFVEKELKSNKKRRLNVVVDKINNDHSGALVQPEKKNDNSAKPKQNKKPDKKAGDTKRLPKLVLKRKPETAVATDPRADKIRQLLQERMKDAAGSKSSNQQLLDNLNRLPELEREKKEKHPNKDANSNRLSAMEREILAGQK